ncbi:hypothetical protein ACS0TY_030752 [Phlomoides rotata]
MQFLFSTYFLNHCLGSPLFVAVQALVKGKSVDADLPLKSYVSLCLRSIFNVIKKAEGAVDAQMTPLAVEINEVQLWLC